MYETEPDESGQEVTLEEGPVVIYCEPQLDGGVMAETSHPESMMGAADGKGEFLGYRYQVTNTCGERARFVFSEIITDPMGQRTIRTQQTPLIDNGNTAVLNVTKTDVSGLPVGTVVSYRVSATGNSGTGYTITVRPAFTVRRVGAQPGYYIVYPATINP